MRSKGCIEEVPVTVCNDPCAPACDPCAAPGLGSRVRGLLFNVAYETYSMVFDAMVVAAVHPLAKAVAKQLLLAVAKQLS